MHPNSFGFHIWTDAAKSEGWERCFLDIYEIKGTPRRLNRVDVAGIRPTEYSLFFFGVHLFWLDVHKNTPLLQVTIVDKERRDSASGSGNQYFVAFPKGWRGDVVIQRLASGLWRDSGTAGQHNEIYWGEDGKAVIESRLFPTTGELDAEESRKYSFAVRWDGKTFVLTQPLSDLAFRYYSPPSQKTGSQKLQSR